MLTKSQYIKVIMSTCLGFDYLVASLTCYDFSHIFKLAGFINFQRIDEFLFYIFKKLSCSVVVKNMDGQSQFLLNRVLKGKLMIIDSYPVRYMCVAEILHCARI